jgi:hypothetical protein
VGGTMSRTATRRISRCPADTRSSRNTRGGR